MSLNKLKITFFNLALFSNLVACCCPWEVTSDGGATNDGDGGSNVESTSSGETVSDGGCNQGGAGGSGGDADEKEEGPWSNSCDWCNGPGCEELDRACIDVESGSRGVTCFDESDTLGPEDHCFPTLDAYHWNRPVLCCCEPGVCPGV